jgi:DNA-binding CsgD family transcriptional regulator
MLRAWHETNAPADAPDRLLMCPVLIGRAAPLAAVRRLVDGDDPQARVALIGGEAGIGKSRLVRAAREYALERGFVTLQAACFPEDGASPYACVADLLRARFAGLPRDEVFARTAPFAGHLSSVVPELIGDSSGVPRAPMLDGPSERRHLIAALAHCLGEQLADRPVLLSVDDLQWADRGSLDVLLEFLRRASSTRIVLLATYRPEGTSQSLRRALTQLVRAGSGFELTLGPLAGQEVEAMLSATLGQAAPLDLVDAIQPLAEGNPLFVEELLRALALGGELVHRAGRWRLLPRVGSRWRLPRSVEDAVQEQVATLGPTPRSVLLLAAVVGRRFDLRLLQRVGGLDEATLIAAVRELVAAQLVLEDAPDWFTFRHALTREAVYASLLGRERARLHRQVAEAAEELYRATTDHLEDLALHFHQAEVWDKALDYGRAAGERAQRLHAPDAAVSHFTRALEAGAHLLEAAGPRGSPALERTLTTIRRARGTAFETLGHVEQARDDFETTLAVARRIADPVLEWHSLVDLGQLWAASDYARSGAVLTAALELARRLDDARLIAHSLNRVGNWRVNTGDPREALPLHREALAIFERLGDRPGIATTLDLLGMASYLSADLQGAVASYERAAALFAELDDRPGLVTSLATLALRGGSFELGSATSDAGTIAAGLRDGERAAALARASGWRAGEAFALQQLALVHLLLGDYGPALTAATRALQIADDIGHRQWLAAARWILGAIHLDLLALSTARRYLEEALALAREVQSTFWVQLISGCLGHALVLDGDLDRAVTILGPAPDAAVAVRSLGERWINYGHVHLALAQGRPALALRLVDRASAPRLDGAPTRETPRPALARAAALQALGRSGDAEQVLASVEAIALRQGARPLLWRCLAQRGNLRLSRGQTRDAERDLTRARALVLELAAGVADDELAQHLVGRALGDSGRPARPRATSVPLSAREMEVARLVAQGLSNREIAERLVISKWTADNHVANILRKLDLARRAQVATWLAAADIDR